MKGVTVVKGVLLSLAVLGFCLPQSAFAVEVTSGRMPGVIDVGLLDGGLLVGQVVDAQGVVLKNVPVSLRRQGQEVAKAQTDDRGYFAVKGLRGGMYQIVAAKGHGMYRLWAPGQAPPSAQKGVLVVAGRDMVRGQGPLGANLGFWLSNPFVIGGIVAASIAVPIAVHNSERPRSP